MRMYDIIQKKRDGGMLSAEEIRFFVQGYTKGEIPDYQVSALCMAIYFRGMTDAETAQLTFAIRDSGEQLDLSSIDGLRVDKHSTGGVGDKTSLVVAPIIASCGIKIAKMSGRGLGHTGGTVDKLESIEGFRTDLSKAEFEETVNRTGISIIGQSADLAPADKLLYALRDVTATVDSMPLIASSIMGKKLAANDDCIVLDVKTGSGSFMKTVEDSEALARLMVEIGSHAGKKVLALITDMDVPLGNAIGNNLEVKEAIETLHGNGPEDFRRLCLQLSAYMLELAEKGSYEECLQMATEAISSGRAFTFFCNMVQGQGGNVEWVQNPALFPKANYIYEVLATESGYISCVNTEGYGVAALLLGAGRNTKEDVIDFTAGIVLSKKTGDFVRQGEVIATLYSNRKDALKASAAKIQASTVISQTPPEKRPLIFSVVRPKTN